MAKTKGATSFVFIPFGQLSGRVPEGTPIPVSRRWLRDNGLLEETEVKVEKVTPIQHKTEEVDKKEEKIAFKVL